MTIKCFKCGIDMIETRNTPVGELPPKEPLPPSIYLIHPGTACRVADYVIQIGYRA